MGVCPKGYNVAWWRRALRIALVNPPQDTTCPLPPMGLSLIAAVLERKGHRVTVVGASLCTIVYAPVLITKAVV